MNFKTQKMDFNSEEIEGQIDTFNIDGADPYLKLTRGESVLP